MVVGYLTLALHKNVSPDSAREFVDDIASYALNLGAVDAVKCDVGVLGENDEQEFWREAAES